MKDIKSKYNSWKGWEEKSFATKSKKMYGSYKLILDKANVCHNDKNPDYKVLEIGFGNGIFMQYAKLLGWDIYGTEINNESIETARRKNFKVKLTDNLDSYDSEYFDLVIALDVMEHVSKKDLEKFLFDVKRVLIKGGKFVARVPNGDSPFGLPLQNGDITHQTVIGSGIMKYLANSLGLKIKFLGAEPRTLNSSQFYNSIPIFIIEILKKVGDILIKNCFYKKKSNISFFSPNLLTVMQK